MFRVLLVRILVALSMAFGSTAFAQQTGPLIAELVEYQEVRAAIPASTPKTFARVFRPSSDQQEAADVLISAARIELARFVNRHLRTVRDDPTLEQMKSSEADVLVQAANVERQLLADLRAILTQEQQVNFEAFERAHRRSLLRKVRPRPLPVDLWVFFDKNRFDPQSDESLVALLEKFDRDSDDALVRQRQALKAYYASVRLGFDGSDESQERDRRTKKELFASNAHLDRVFASMVEPLLGTLPREVGDSLVVEAIQLANLDFDKTISQPERFPVTREVLALELTPEQRGKAQSIIRSAKAEALTLARTCLVDQARFVLMDSERRDKVRTAPNNEYLEYASKLRIRVSNDLLSLLTPKQREAYDASDVVDPSTSSTVDDE